MSITTKQGDGGETSLVGGIRVSKGDLRVEAYGTIDELNAALGFARSICTNAEISSWTRDIQKTLFHIGSALATVPESQKGAAPLAAQDVDSLTDLVHAIEDREGILSDWSLPGAHTEAAVFDVARTVCRRAERRIVRLIEEGDAGRAPHPQVLPYINRLSDLIWLFGRLLERESGVDSRLRGEQHKGARWSKAGETSEKRLFNAIKKPPCIVRLVSGQRSAAAIFRDRSMLIHRQSRTWKHWVRLASMIFSRILVRH